MVYSVGMARTRERSEAISFRTTPTVKRLLLAVKQKDGYASEAATMEAIIREAARTRRLEPVSEEFLAEYKAPAAKQAEESLASEEGR